jgi:hypothetical protein
VIKNAEASGEKRGIWSRAILAVDDHVVKGFGIEVQSRVKVAVEPKERLQGRGLSHGSTLNGESGWVKSENLAQLCFVGVVRVWGVVTEIFARAMLLCVYLG